VAGKKLRQTDQHQQSVFELFGQKLAKLRQRIKTRFAVYA
jgi:hypothetical protein